MNFFFIFCLSQILRQNGRRQKQEIEEKGWIEILIIFLFLFFFSCQDRRKRDRKRKHGKEGMDFFLDVKIEGNEIERGNMEEKGQIEIQMFFLEIEGQL